MHLRVVHNARQPDAHRAHGVGDVAFVGFDHRLRVGQARAVHISLDQA